jgi:hypothetical protein|tara:strand:+ start:366 stop:1463 length:1098 start_codon:yes stop_codon:yes gene_type:complete
MAGKNGYIGRSPSDSAVQVARQSYTASGITTDFTFNSGYTPGYFDIYINGVKVIEGSDYTSSDGSTFSILNGGASDGDAIEAVAYKAFNATSVSEAAGNFTVGSDLVVNGSSTLTGNATVGSAITLTASTGIVSATAFYGDGSNLSGIEQGVGINSGGTNIGYGITSLNFIGSGTTIVVSGTSANITPFALRSTDDIGIRNISGVAATFTGNVNVGGVLTYEDATNIDSIGIITARTGIKVLAGGINAVGVATATHFSGNLTGTAVTATTFLGNVSGTAVTATTFTGNITGNVTGNVGGNVTGDVTGNVTGNVNSTSATGVSTVGILTAYSSISINVGSGSTEVATALETKASTGKAIAMSIVFG